MNRMGWTASVCMGLFLVALIAGCVATSTQQSTGEYIDDIAITANVKVAIYRDKTLKVGQISVESFKGIVQLSGFVNNEETSLRAEEVAKTVRGVRDVKNSLIVK